MFLYGMRLMSGALKEGSAGTLKKIIEKVTDNVVKSFLLGVFVTALIQSSTATIVITSGLVAAGIITLRQSLGIIVGANIGTTVTGQIIRLMDLNSTGTSWLQFFKPDTLAPIALIAGIILIMFMKFKKSENIGTICMGFGILFTGLINMTNAVSALNAGGAFDSLFEHLSDNALLGYGIGALVSFILQSSSATVGILQAFSVSGQLYFKSIYPVILGIYLGDSVTTGIVCSIGATSEAKKVGIVHVLYNLTKMVIVFVGVFILKQVGLLDGIWNEVANSGLIANTNTVFNIVCALLIIPFISQYEKLTNKFVKEDETSISKYSHLIAGLDDKFFATPALAFKSAYDVLNKMFDLAYINISKAFDILVDFDDKKVDEINEEEENLDVLTDKVTNYIHVLYGHISDDESMRIASQYYSVASEFERLGDHAVNICEAAVSLKENGVSFSGQAIEELAVIRELIETILTYTCQAFETRDIDAAYHIEPLEEVTDDMVLLLKDNHVKRLQKGECNVFTGTIFLNLLNDIERISDVCSNIGIATIARVNPDKMVEAHDYMSRLHNGNNTTFNLEYDEAHEHYFDLLDQIEEERN